MGRQLLARAVRAAGAGPGDSPLTIDLDSTICETYGLAKEGARPSLAQSVGAGLSPPVGRRRRANNWRRADMSRLREGRANTARGAAHFLRETVSPPGSPCRRASGQLTVPGGPTAASTPTLSSPPVVRWMSASPKPSSHPPAVAKPAEPDRGDSRCRLDAGPLLDGRRRRCRRDDWVRDRREVPD